MLGLLHPLLLSDVVLFVFSSYRISHLEEEDDEAFLVSSSAHYCWVNKCNCSEEHVPQQFQAIFQRPQARTSPWPTRMSKVNYHRTANCLTEKRFITAFGESARLLQK